MPIAIAGMHRSGTSMVTRLLNLGGLHLGPESELQPPHQESNPEGHWELVPFVAINDELLTQLGGRWDLPPKTIPMWAANAKLQPLRNWVETLVANIGFVEPWGWKDPRNSLTMPFWLSIWPNLRVVVCVRHPLEVAQSHFERDGFGYLASLKLWQEYYKALVGSIPGERRIVTHYNSYFGNPEQEVARLLNWAGLPADDHRMHATLASIVRRLRNSQFSKAILRSLPIPDEISAMYEALCSEAKVEASHDPVGSCQRELCSTIRLAIRMEVERNEKSTALTARDQLIAFLQNRLAARRHRYANVLAEGLRRVTRLLSPFRLRKTI